MDRQTDAPWTEPAGALQARLAISIPLFLISYSKAGRGMNSIPACESHYTNPLSRVDQHPIIRRASGPDRECERG